MAPLTSTARTATMRGYFNRNKKEGVLNAIEKLLEAPGTDETAYSSLRTRLHRLPTEDLETLERRIKRALENSFSEGEEHARTWSGSTYDD